MYSFPLFWFIVLYNSSNKYNSENMSVFKRYQSKVFWEQMASRDLENDHFIEKNKPSHHIFNESLCEKENEEEDSNSKSENDTIDGENITAIRVSSKSDESSKQDVCQISLTHEESIVHHRYVE